MKRTGDVIILGGGVIGLTTAYFLAKEGADVIVCDQGKVGMESSWAGAGILPPSDPDHAQLPLDRLLALSGQLFPGLSRELKDRTGIDNELYRCGGLQFDHLADDAHVHEWYGLGATTKVLSERDALALEPALAPKLGAALHIPDMAQLRNPRHMQALRGACIDTKKITFLEDAPAQGFVVEKSRVKEVRTPSEVLSGGIFLAAAGAWTDRLLESVGCRLNIQPVRGQIALLNPGAVVFRNVLVRGAQYLVSRLDGRVLVGSTEEKVGFAKYTTAEAIGSLLDMAIRLVPCLAGAALEKTWAGFRPGSPDGLPFIGLAPNLENLYVAAGHYRAGIQLSPGTGLILKQMILKQPLTMPMDAFRLNR